MNNVFNTVGFFECVQEGDIIYGALEDKNGFCAVNIKNHECTLIDTFVDEMISSQRLYHSIIKVEHYLVLVPANAGKIAIFDLNSGVMKYVENTVTKKTVGPSYRNVLKINGEVYILGDLRKDIIKLDLDMLETTIVVDFEKEFVVDVESVFGEGYAIYDEKIYIPLTWKPSFLVMNKLMKNYIIMDLDLPIDGIGGVEQEDNNIWIVGKGEKNNFLCQFDMSTQDINTYEIPKGVLDISYPYWKPICTEKYIYIFPLFEKRAYMFSKDKKEFFELKCISELIDFNSACSQFAVMGIRKQKDVISFILGKDFGWYDFNIDNNNVSKVEIDFCIDDEKYRKTFANEVFLQNSSSNTIFYETRLPLELFLNEIADGE